MQFLHSDIILLENVVLVFGLERSSANMANEYAQVMLSPPMRHTMGRADVLHTCLKQRL